MAIASFLKQYHTILFDMDGVITSEQNYWNCAALTVYEYLHSNKFYGTETISAAWCMEHVAEIRSDIFYQDKTIKVLKERGVNSNWDLGYIVFALYKTLPHANAESIYHYILENFHDNICDDYDAIAHNLQAVIKQPADRASDFWYDMTQVFQHWFLSDSAFVNDPIYQRSAHGKPGFLKKEQPIIRGEILKNLMKELYECGIKLGIATGRPKAEMLAPLASFGIEKYIDSLSKISYTHIKEAEKKFSGTLSLTKPHPYIFLKSLLGEDFPDKDIVEDNYDHSLCAKTLVVGDAGSDILAAQAMGADFLAVLTGVSGLKGRSYFEKIGATYILNSLEDAYQE